MAPNRSLSAKTFDNRLFWDQLAQRDRLMIEAPHRLIPWLLRPCRVRVLLVADGGLDFGLSDFGLRTFVTILQTIPQPALRLEITLAHRRSEKLSDDAVMAGQAGIVRSIKGIKFDDQGHFGPKMYDQVWLFGIDAGGELSAKELRALSEFMNGGGGLFATGDHGALGRALCGSLPRARSMRLWDSTIGPTGQDEVSMNGARRNDTNRIGHDAGSQFNDQSDDVPQEITPRLYRRRVSALLNAVFPHPLLCGPRGKITVLPDHPHEGECVEPTDTNKSDTFDGYSITEFPPGVNGSPRPLPQVIAWSTVLPGMEAGRFGATKAATDAHTFGAICAYDGHRANVGRVVTDATWHHFVNVNLVGEMNLGQGVPKGEGFLFSPEGQAVLEDIKAYYRNIAMWICPSERLRCIRRRICWNLVWHHRVIEAVTVRPDLGLRQLDALTILGVGRHARDALGVYASQCQAAELALDLVWPHLPETMLEILDPWAPPPIRRPQPAPDPLPWLDPQPVLDLALGAALVALREAFPDPDVTSLERVEASLDEVLARGVRTGLDHAVRSLNATMARYRELVVLEKKPRVREPVLANGKANGTGRRRRAPVGTGRTSG